MTAAGARSLVFTGEEQVRLEAHALAVPGPGEVEIRTRCSAISAGTELLFFRGQAPDMGALDAVLDPHSRPQRFPMRCGYCTVGEVEATGPQVDAAWLGRRVFAYHPHSTRFIAKTDTLIALPDAITDESAVFVPNMETAVGLVMDGRPVLGERVVVFGLGIVGLLTTALLAEHPLASLFGVDAVSRRRGWGETLGAGATFGPDEVPAMAAALAAEEPLGGADLCFEVSGNPDALDQAVAIAGYAGRIVVGSWYGDRSARLNLGGRFHRAKQTIASSQVSAIHPAYSGRWDKRRRMHVVFDAIERLEPSRLITHRCRIEDAQEAYAMLAERRPDVLQVVFTYP